LDVNQIIQVVRRNVADLQALARSIQAQFHAITLKEGRAKAFYSCGTLACGAEPCRIVHVEDDPSPG